LDRLIGLDNPNPSKVLFSGVDAVKERRLDNFTCVLLISQSGQTFPTLHATRKLAHLIGDRLWIMTGIGASTYCVTLQSCRFHRM
jgi:hypothetical protein